MRKRRARGRKPTEHLKDASDLRRELSDFDRQISETESEMAVVLSEKARRDGKRLELLELLARVKLHGSSTRIFGFTFKSQDTKAQIRAVTAAISELDGGVAVEGRSWASIGQASHHLERRWSDLQLGRNRLVSQLQRAERTEARQQGAKQREELEEERRRRKAEKIAIDRALAARAKGTIRVDAAMVGKRLRRDHPCPYCGGSLGFRPHKDHIYPVSKGGLSTERNLVYVCQPCNQQKRGDTLNQFVERAGFDHNVVRRRLKDLGKDC